MKGLLVLCLAALAAGVPVREDAVAGIRDCLDGDLMLCLKEKALGFSKALVGSSEFSLLDGVTLKNTASARSARSYEALSTDVKVRENQVEERLADNVQDIIDGFVLQLRMPKSLLEEENEIEEEGRGKKGKKKLKKLLPLLAILKVKLAALVPLFLGIIALVAVKAFVLGKIAFIAAALTLLKKLLDSKKQGWSEPAHVVHEESHGWESSGGGGWGRSSIEAQKLAYAAQLKQTS